MSARTYSEGELAKAVAEARAAERADWQEVANMREAVIAAQDKRIAGLEAALEKATADKPSRESLRREFEKHFAPGEAWNLTRQGVLHRLDPGLAAELRAKYTRDIFKAA